MQALLCTEAIRVESYVGPSDERSLADDVLDGLTRPFKELPPKHFYDAVGAELFDRICELPEYYPTRAERAILEERSTEIVATTGATELVELGSGTAAKTRLLLSAMAEAETLRRYVPVDVTEAMVVRCADALVDEFPGLRVHGIVGDFERHLRHVPEPDGPRVVAFLGGTIGNFTPGSRRRFLRGLAKLLRPGVDHLLLGTDLVKDPAILEAAYDDSAGVTAEFNRNILRVINRGLDGDFVPEAFRHHARYDEAAGRIEMHLVAATRQVAQLRQLGLTLELSQDESIWTESSYKFTRESAQASLAGCGLAIERWYSDGAFALLLARPGG